jgi:hypothetical protein
MALTISRQGPAEPAVFSVQSSAPVVAGSAWTLLGVLSVRGLPGRSLLQGNVAVAALTGLQVTRGAYPGAHTANDVIVLAADAALSTAALGEVTASASAHNTAAGGIFQVMLNNSGVAEYGLWAKSGGTATVEIRGTCA